MAEQQQQERPGGRPRATFDLRQVEELGKIQSTQAELAAPEGAAGATGASGPFLVGSALFRAFLPRAPSNGAPRRLQRHASERGGGMGVALPGRAQTGAGGPEVLTPTYPVPARIRVRYQTLPDVDWGMVTAEEAGA
jgi:hypothetical protein